MPLQILSVRFEVYSAVFELNNSKNHGKICVFIIAFKFMRELMKFLLYAERRARLLYITSAELVDLIPLHVVQSYINYIVSSCDLRRHFIVPTHGEAMQPPSPPLRLSMSVVA